jgi:hypothetical protein
MKRIFWNIILVITVGISVISCGPNKEEKSKSPLFSKTEKSDKKTEVMDEQTVASDSISFQSSDMSSGAAVVNHYDTLRKFIRTADLNFKVKNVYNATHRIEDLTKSFGGFVTESALNNEIRSTDTKEISNDSSVVISEYVITSALTLRVPQNNLDTFLRSLTPLVEFINKRIVTANDIHIDLLKTQLDQLRNQNFVDETSQIKTKSTNTRLAALQVQADADAAKIDRLIMLDKIEYSTVNIAIYQDSQIRYDMIANRDTKRFDPSFGTRLMESLEIGFIIIEELFLLAIKLWGLVVTGFGIYFLAMFIYRKTKKE